MRLVVLVRKCRTPKHLGNMMSARILIIEDDARMAQSLQHILMRDGYETIVQQGSEGARAFLRESKCDLIVLDLCLDRGTFDTVAQEFLEAVAELAGRVPIVGITCV